ncbi:MAG: hypothetical protein HWE24_19325 [Oceanospirillaceae bacterium]|nr:hypothetical protein [Oceanospirillaceae bacterium]
MADAKKIKQEPDSCFAIMPISDVDGYPKGHFAHVYDDIIVPASEEAGFKAVRADEVKQTNLIHLDILQKLIEAPIAVCDLSTRNPNVLFELGIRQAFDRPVVLIQEKGTPKIFDITPLRYLEYSKDMKYHEVKKSQLELKEAIEATSSASGDPSNINSIVKLLGLGKAAQIPDVENQKESLAIEYMQSEMRDVRRMIESFMLEGRGGSQKYSISAIEYERISKELDSLTKQTRMSSGKREQRFHELMMETEEFAMMSSDKSDYEHFHRLMKRIQKAMHDVL